MSMNPSRLASSGLAILGTALGFSFLNAFTPIELLNPAQLGQLNGQWAVAADAEEDVNVRVYRQASPAVVAIETRTGSGSGSIVSEDGLVLTNAHVVRGSQTVTVRLADGREFEGEVVAYGQGGLDLAAVQIQANEDNLPYVPLAQPEAVEVGQRAFAIGSPFGFQGTFTTGIVSRIDRDRGLIQTDAAINPGNSGGPLLNSRGELIGVNSAIFTPSNGSGNVGIGFAIATDRVDSFLVAVRDGTALSTPDLPPLLAGGRPAERLTLNEVPFEVKGDLNQQSSTLPSDNSYFNAYTFDAAAGQHIVVEMSSDDLNPYLILLSSDGGNIAQSGTRADDKSQIEITLPIEGTYTILANSLSAGETGQYTLKISTTGISPVLLQEEGSLGEGSQVLEEDGSLYNEYEFQGEEGQTVSIYLESEEFDTFLILMDENGEMLAQNDDTSPSNLNSLITVTLPTSGTYRILANAFDSAGRGNYTLTVR
ncbi:serine protease [filamentous cyanobacterium CCP1]|nr:serine protease [filamentous cyanobacterium CCP1]